MFHLITYRIRDAEAGGRLPAIFEAAKLRWLFIRNIFALITLQLFLPSPIALVVVSFQPILNSLISTYVGFEIYFCILLIQLIVLGFLYFYHQKEPLNYLLLGAFMFSVACTLGGSCAFSSGYAIIVAVGFSCLAFLVLTMYTFLAEERGWDFNFFPIFIIGLIPILLVFSLIQLLFPDPISRQTTNEGGVGALLFVGYIVYCTKNVLRTNMFEEHIWAAVSLYFLAVHIFISLLVFIKKANG